ncbi:MAG TPA: Asp-tRNA(Asn)/Glu-tRNA(Gln) amidotransferase subunit GatB [Patescibacteria group bacterium]|nr:Asp-tRNA(Asn)/Glu-tRNA(Gln) amidotransferase subunit GatB [Patescibacteria group bacterium]
MKDNNTPSATRYMPVIGLEVHVELKTKSKMFCQCSANYFGEKPNTDTCPVCLGLPGALPVPNKQAIEWCVMIALALNCKILNNSKFDRKNYFYPDLSKGYQISQYDEPFGLGGFIMVRSTPESKTEDKKIGVTRVHMEEDTGKLTHIEGASLIDFNRSGVPLVEIVTEPDFESAFQVTQYLQKLQQIVRYLGVSNADMEKGDMRLEPNISLREITTDNEPLTTDKLPKYKVEVKNINSFRFVARAIEEETIRQAEILDKGELPPQETRGWNEAKNTTVSQRIKEEANDYRYFPEPDIPPIIMSDKEINDLRSQIPELPTEKLERFIKEFGITEYDAEILTRERSTADYFEEAAKEGTKHNITPKQIANYIINKKPNLDETVPTELVELILTSQKTEDVSEEDLNNAITKAFEDNPKVVEEYKSGKVQVIGFLIGKTRALLPAGSSTVGIKEAIEERLK